MLQIKAKINGSLTKIICIIKTNLDEYHLIRPDKR